VAFEAARQRDLHSKDKKVREAAAAYGDKNKDNAKRIKVNITFDDKNPGAEGEVGFGRDQHGKANGTVNVIFNKETFETNVSNLKQSDETVRGGAQAALDEVVAHEGVHVIQDTRLINSGYDAKFDISIKQAEEEAYSMSNRVIDNELHRSNPEWSSKGAIDKALQAHKDQNGDINRPILDRRDIPH
jgi:hypothetical protein